MIFTRICSIIAVCIPQSISKANYLYNILCVITLSLISFYFTDKKDECLMSARTGRMTYRSSKY